MLIEEVKNLKEYKDVESAIIEYSPHHVRLLEILNGKKHYGLVMSPCYDWEYHIAGHVFVDAQFSCVEKNEILGIMKSLEKVNKLPCFSRYIIFDQHPFKISLKIGEEKSEKLSSQWLALHEPCDDEK